MHSLKPTDEERPSASGRNVNPILLWTGVLGGPIAFALDRLAGVVLVSGSCRGSTPATSVLGLTSAQAMTAAITVITALIAIMAGLISWKIWHDTGSPEEEVSVGGIARVPFWALGGMILSAFFFVAIVVTGTAAVAVSTSCPQ